MVLKLDLYWSGVTSSGSPALYLKRGLSKLHNDTLYTKGFHMTSATGREKWSVSKDIKKIKLNRIFWRHTYSKCRFNGRLGWLYTILFTWITHFYTNLNYWIYIKFLALLIYARFAGTGSYMLWLCIRFYKVITTKQVLYVLWKRNLFSSDFLHGPDTSTEQKQCFWQHHTLSWLLHELICIWWINSVWSP